MHTKKIRGRYCSDQKRGSQDDPASCDVAIDICLFFYVNRRLFFNLFLLGAQNTIIWRTNIPLKQLGKADHRHCSTLGIQYIM
jgi:hypothetical protein